MWNEYKKHVRATYLSVLPISGLLIVCFIIWNLLFSMIAMPTIREYQSLKELGFSYAVVSSKQTDAFPALKKFDNLVTFKNDHNKRANINNYIQMDRNIFPEEILGPRDIAISQKMADNLGLKIDSKVSAGYTIYEEPIVYSVKKILPYLSDLYETKKNRDFSFAIVGFDNELFHHTQGHFVYLLDEQEFTDYMSADNSYSATYNLKMEKESLQKDIQLLSIAFFISMILAFVLIGINAHHMILTEVVKYYRDGFGTDIVCKINWLDHAWVLGGPAILEIVWMTCYQISLRVFLHVFSAATLTLALGVIFFGIAGGRQFGRANHI